jgi:hypothetical protein
MNTRSDDSGEVQEDDERNQGNRNEEADDDHPRSCGLG